MLEKIMNSIKNNHFAQMAICCALPIVIIIGLQILGFNSIWIYPLAIVTCIGSHMAMMYFTGKDGKKSCH